MAAENRNKSVRASFIIKFANLNTLIVIFAVVARRRLVLLDFCKL